MKPVRGGQPAGHAPGADGRPDAEAAASSCCGPRSDSGADAAEARKAIQVEPRTKELVLRRLRRIEGQVRGLQKMVEEERYCADVMTQILAVQESLRAASGELLRNHLRHCVAGALQCGDPASAERVVAELASLFERAGRQ